MTIADVTENAILNLIFSATAWANYADNAAIAAETDIDVALHIDDPGDNGTMSTNEADYTGYARASVPRGLGWTLAVDGMVNPVNNIDFPMGSGGVGLVSHFSTGKSGGGAAPILFYGTITPEFQTGNGIPPRLTVATTIYLD